MVGSDFFDKIHTLKRGFNVLMATFVSSIFFKRFFYVFI